MCAKRLGYFFHRRKTRRRPSNPLTTISGILKNLDDYQPHVIVRLGWDAIVFNSLIRESISQHNKLMSKSIHKSKIRRRIINHKKRQMTLQSFGNCIRKLRQQKGLTPTQLARKSGLDSSNLNKYETGIREPGLFVILLIAETLKVNPLDLCNCHDLKKTQLISPRNNDNQSSRV